MSKRPIFVATHPRACSTAFERVFMTRREALKCVHEPFGDAFYFGPERLSKRYEGNEQARIESGFSGSTYRTVFERLVREASELAPKIFPELPHHYDRSWHTYMNQGKRLFIKDIIHYIVPPDGMPASVAPSLLQLDLGLGAETLNRNASANGLTTDMSFKPKRPPYPYGTHPEANNPTVIPTELLGQFHFTFLIRDPHYSIPSYYRCTIPPLDEITGFYQFYESEAGYDEVRRVFDYLRELQLVGPHYANDIGHSTAEQNEVKLNGFANRTEICVIDADALLDDPAGVVERYCRSVGERFDPRMLNWDSEEEQTIAKEAFSKWKGFHEDAINSKSLKPRVHAKQIKSEAEFDEEWRRKYGEKGAKIIRAAVDRNMADYQYMKKFSLET